MFHTLTFTREYFDQYICYDTRKSVRALCTVFKAGISKCLKSITDIARTKFIEEFTLTFWIPILKLSNYFDQACGTSCALEISTDKSAEIYAWSLYQSKSATLK